MKLSISIALIFGCLFCFGEESEKLVKTVNGKMMTQTQIREITKQANMRRYGGYVRKENSAEGVFVVLNAQVKFPFDEISKVIETIDQRVRIQSKVVNLEAKNISASNMRDAITKAGGVAGVALVEVEQKTPALLSATEEGWAIINITRLAEDKPNQEVLNKRIRCELLRGFAFAVGGVYCARGDFLMQPIREPKDLDAITQENFAVTMLQTFSLTTPRYGLIPWIEKTYLKACEEGWASQPTNEYQKAIWDKIHQPPKNPMKIEFDPKKGR